LDILEPTNNKSSMNFIVFSAFRAYGTCFAEILNPERMEEMSSVCVADSPVGETLSDSFESLKLFFIERGVTQDVMNKIKEFVFLTRVLYLMSRDTDTLIKSYVTLDSNDVSVLATPEISIIGKETKETVRREIVYILNARSIAGDSIAAAFAKEKVQQDRMGEVIRSHFALPPSDVILQDWDCSCEKRGTLFLTSSNLCFDLDVGPNKESTEYSWVIELSLVTKLKKEKKNLFTKVLTVEYTEGKKTLTKSFSFAFAKLSPLAEAIYAQAKSGGNKDIKNEVDPSS